MTSTWPTPSELSSCRRSTLSAYSVISRSGLSRGDGDGQHRRRRGIELLDRRLDHRARQQREDAVDLVAHFLRRDVRRPSRARTTTTTCETPSDEFEVSVSMPLMVLTASSILSVTSVSICSGAAPGRRVVIDDRRDVDVRESDRRRAA